MRIVTCAKSCFIESVTWMTEALALCSIFFEDGHCSQMTIKASKVKRNTKPSQVQAILGSRGRRYIYKEIPSSPIRGSSSRLQSKTPRTPRTPQHQQHGLDQVNLNEVGDDNGGDFPEFNIPKTKVSEKSKPSISVVGIDARFRRPKTTICENGFRSGLHTCKGFS